MSEKELIESITAEVAEICDPSYVYLVSKKNNVRGELTTMKLCVVVDDGIDPSGEEKRLLIKTDTPIPVDFIVYNISDWNDYAPEDNTFAYRIENGGELLYVKGK
ncbi:MAG: hypothetical protein J6F31_01525 [Oscillospiraceae bacterium]|nr:hypothetical protein [Oscillospiraceae bacterium]